MDSVSIKCVHIQEELIVHVVLSIWNNSVTNLFEKAPAKICEMVFTSEPRAQKSIVIIKTTVHTLSPKRLATAVILPNGPLQNLLLLIKYIEPARITRASEH